MAAAGAPEPDCDPGVGAQAVSQGERVTGHGDQANCGATCAQVGGRSWVIHAFFVGL
jgi:hypothetical protein